MNAPTTGHTNSTVKDDYVHQIGKIEVRLPSLTYLKPGLVRRLRRLGEMDATFSLIELSVSPEALAAVDDMDPEEYGAMLNAWRQHSGVNLGES